MMFQSKPNLKSIQPADVKLGMYVHGFQGSWMSHPFWRTGFVLTDAGMVDTIRRSSVAAVLIDITRGAPVDEATPHAPVKAAAARERGTELTAEQREQDRRLAMRVADEAKRVVKQIFDGVRSGNALDLTGVPTVVETISDALSHNRAMLIGVLRLKTKDEYTYHHSVSVCTLMVNLARELRLDEGEVQRLGLAGLFHDIGKVGISEAILNKPGQLNDIEFEAMRQHTRHGHALLSSVEGLPEVALDVCLHHHERIDGTGYPFGLGADKIGLAARMGAICDVYDALTSTRVYKSAYSPIAAVTAMASWEGHFDQKLLFSFMKSIACFPAGTLVRLGSAYLAIVRDNGRRASRARLSIFYDIAERRLIEPRECYLSDHDEDALPLSDADPADYDLPAWPTLRAALLEGRPEHRSAA